ncbi:putative zinc finger protein CONSTANS-LIKE 11 isoform X2 [Magnolia sinica]|uniref:putative zinc finger protein CONSTANS-LIKE 11 isoform X2 n=1 Tax=Magnolia sinica TaxID=86752 RepID=UPI00265927DB|nr:putative zinc finger protein CONSTANS-LIKE 11 isoform X2 [Magnolia sinica]
MIDVVGRERIKQLLYKLSFPRPTVPCHLLIPLNFQHLNFSMASISDFSCDFSFSTDFQDQILPCVAGEGDFGLPNVESFPFDDGSLEAISSKKTDMGLSDFHTSFPDRFGVTETNVAGPVLPEFDSNPYCDVVPMQSPAFGFCPGANYELVEEDGGFNMDFWPVYGARDLWEIHGNSLRKSGEPVMKAARYTVEERKDRILKYLKKRNQRNFNKTIKYACRKTLADRRRRVRGRFASNSENQRKEEEYHKDCSQVNILGHLFLWHKLKS